MKPYIAKLLLSLTLSGLTCSAQAMEFIQDPSSTGSLILRDGTTNVLTYNYGDKLQNGVDPKYTRSCYVHPLWSLDGKTLTDDFPEDHPHHRGVFWTWPIVKTHGVQSQTWHPHQPVLRQHFVRWTERSADKNGASLKVENRWLLDDKEEVAREHVSISVSPVTGQSRTIDFVIKLEAVGGPLTLQGSQEAKKGYGGFCVRTAPAVKGAQIATDTGKRSKDIVNEPHKWVDLSTDDHGLAIFVAPDHPGYPTPFMARNSYAGFLNASWPGLSPTVISPGKPVELRYRLYIHQGQIESGTIQDAYENYLNSLKTLHPAANRSL